MYLFNKKKKPTYIFYLHTHTQSSLLSPDDLQIWAVLVLRLFWISPGGFWEVAETLQRELDQCRVVEHIQETG